MEEDARNEEAKHPAARGAQLNELFGEVYGELRRLARGQRWRRRRQDETLNTTALIHEAYLKLSSGRGARWESRGHFLALAATAMRQILIDHSRQAQAAKRGGDHEQSPITISSLPDLAPKTGDELLALDSALQRLEALDPRQARIVECRFFGGFDVEETAEAVGVSTATVKRDWRVARAWLYRELGDGVSAG